MFSSNLPFGKRAEELACEYLKKQGLEIVARNIRRSGAEIDIVAKDKNVVCFIEVKARTSDKFGLPQEAIDIKKRTKIIHAAEAFLEEQNWLDCVCRFDVLAIRLSGNSIIYEYIKDAFQIER
ncbi:MAG: YraN family protein [Candidatus Omnitrophica bacterium]|nr:YraN family protein [Candidatus Omnitrophota bacterium]